MADNGAEGEASAQWIAKRPRKNKVIVLLAVIVCCGVVSMVEHAHLAEVANSSPVDDRRIKQVPRRKFRNRAFAEEKRARQRELERVEREFNEAERRQQAAQKHISETEKELEALIAEDQKQDEQEELQQPQQVAPVDKVHKEVAAAKEHMQRLRSQEPDELPQLQLKKHAAMLDDAEARPKKPRKPFTGRDDSPPKGRPRKLFEKKDDGQEGGIVPKLAAFRQKKLEQKVSIQDEPGQQEGASGQKKKKSGFIRWDEKDGAYHHVHPGGTSKVSSSLLNKMGWGKTSKTSGGTGGTGGGEIKEKKKSTFVPSNKPSKKKSSRKQDEEEKEAFRKTFEKNARPVKDVIADGKWPDASYKKKWANDKSLRARIRSIVPESQWGPDRPALADEILQNTGCDPYNVAFESLAADKACTEYLIDQSQWVGMEPLESIQATQRTIKFRVSFKQKGLYAIMKPPQKAFIMEPYVEYSSWVADRVVGLNRVPCVGWTYVKTKFIQDVVAKHGDRKYSEWLETELWKAVYKHHMVKDGLLGVSVQLWMHGITAVPDSPFSIPYHHSDPSWYNYFNPQFGYSPKYQIGVLRMAEVCVMDYLLDNNDRSPRKNNHAVGICIGSSKCKKKKNMYPGPPDFVSLDQGSGLYKSTITDQMYNNPLARHTVTFCLFRKHIVAMMDKWRPKEGGPSRPLTDAIVKNLPTEIKNEIGMRSLNSIQARLAQLEKWFDGCVKKYGRDVVIVP